MFRTIKKAYKIACIAIGKKKVHAIMLAIAAGLFLIAYKNDFDIQKTATEVEQHIQTGQDLRSDWTKQFGK